MEGCPPWNLFNLYGLRLRFISKELNFVKVDPITYSNENRGIDNR
jgi:hypothetical protein